MKHYIFYTCAALLLAGTTAHSQGIKIMPGTTFKLVGGAYNLVLADNADFENNATIQTSNLTIKATGTGNSNLKGSALLNIGKLDVDKAPGQNIVLQKNVTVGNSVNFTSGLIDLNNKRLLLGDTALLLNESESSRITGSTGGTVEISHNLNSPLAENPGNLGMVITSGANWGNTRIRRGHIIHPNAGAGGSIARYFEVIPAQNSGLNAFLRAYYFDAELNSLNENALNFYQSSNSGATWSDIGSAGRNSAQNFVNINGIQQMFLFTLATLSDPLPLYLASIKASCIRNQAELRWKLESLSNTSLFHIEKSKDSKEWEQLDATIQVDPDVHHEYVFTDIGEPYSFYRLQCISSDNSIYYSPIQQVNCKQAGYAFTLLQNPVQQTLRIGVNTDTSLKAMIKILDQTGRTLLTQDMNIGNGSSEHQYNVQNFASGMYLLQIISRNKVLWQAKFVNN